MKKLLLILLCFPMIGFGQITQKTNVTISNQINLKELLDMDIITQEEYNKKAKELKNIFLE